jgi:5-methylcytosine-specific restriction enzyme A
LVCDLVAKNHWRGLSKSSPEVAEMSRLLRRAPIHPGAAANPSFRNLNSVRRKSENIASHHPDFSLKPTKGNTLDGMVLADFLQAPQHMHEVAVELRSLLAVKGKAADEVAGVPVGDESEVKEGTLLVKRHIYRERDPKLRAAKINEVKQERGRLQCEVCEFNFAASYGDHGDGFIEIHHKLPLHASGPVRTRMEDLAALCSNCHRMIHRKREWLSVDDLRGLLSK